MEKDKVKRSRDGKARHKSDHPDNMRIDGVNDELEKDVLKDSTAGLEDENSAAQDLHSGSAGEDDMNDDLLAQTEEKYQQLEDKFLRTCAEYDNYRRRTRKEKDALYSDSLADVICKFLPVADNIDRALEQAENNITAETKPYYEGVTLIRKQFDEVLVSMGVEEIAALGETFDPNLHHAVSVIVDEAAGENVITEVFQRGYVRGDRVLRHAVVQVANSC
jgi:molecular chaperone GrpE